MYGYTGTYKGKRISIMGHGMGIPSCSIYAKELITEYGVKNLIRIGSCGAVLDDIHVRDVVIGIGASTDSNVNRIRFHGYDFAAIADFGIVQALSNAAKARGIDAKVGNLFSSDLFYHPDTSMTETLRKYGIVGEKWKPQASTAWQPNSVPKPPPSAPCPTTSCAKNTPPPKSASSRLTT